MTLPEEASLLLLQALFLGGTALGGLVGGAIGDIAARHYPDHGRIAATQFSVAAGVPFSFILLKVRPRTCDSVS